MYFQKPVIKYLPTDSDYIVVGHKAIITPIETDKEILTLPVLHTLEVGFETADTIYKPYSH